MARKFLDGLAFGAGFAISFLAISYAVAFLAMPRFMSGPFSVMDDRTELIADSGLEPSGPPFYELPLEEQIEAATVIARVRYVSSSDGKTKAVFEEILKKRPGTKFHYDIGDEYPRASHYSRKGLGHGDGQIIFFIGSPAQMTMSTTYEDDRIPGLGDMSLMQLRERCRDAEA